VPLTVITDEVERVPPVAVLLESIMVLSGGFLPTKTHKSIDDRLLSSQIFHLYTTVRRLAKNPQNVNNATGAWHYYPQEPPVRLRQAQAGRKFLPEQPARFSLSNVEGSG